MRFNSNRTAPVQSPSEVKWVIKCKQIIFLSAKNENYAVNITRNTKEIRQKLGKSVTTPSQ
jgi:hypothetical protein